MHSPNAGLIEDCGFFYLSYGLSDCMPQLLSCWWTGAADQPLISPYVYSLFFNMSEFTMATTIFPTGVAADAFPAPPHVQALMSTGTKDVLESATPFLQQRLQPTSWGPICAVAPALPPPPPPPLGPPPRVRSPRPLVPPPPHPPECCHVRPSSGGFTPPPAASPAPPATTAGGCWPFAGGFRAATWKGQALLSADPRLQSVKVGYLHRLLKQQWDFVMVQQTQATDEQLRVWSGLTGCTF